IVQRTRGEALVQVRPPQAKLFRANTFRLRRDHRKLTTNESLSPSCHGDGFRDRVGYRPAARSTQISALPSDARSRGSGEQVTLPSIKPHSQVWHTPVRHDHFTGTSQTSAN